jgi:hypothetical protein
MKGRIVAFVGVFCIAMLIVSVANAEKPDRGKPPGPTKLEKELIVFTGDLVGGEVVEGCCLNRGPAPAYTMHVPAHGLGNLENGPYYPPGAYTGHLFINVFGTGRNAEYMVRFRGINDSFGELSIEIMGGVFSQNKKPPKVLTAIFTEADCRVLEVGCPTPGCGEHIAYVNFTLVRTPL